MTVLLIAEHDNAHVKDATHKALTAAAKLGGDIHVLVAGNKADAAAAEAAKLSGVKKVLHCEAPYFERPLAEPMAALDRRASRALRTYRRAGHHQRQELHAARCRPARRDADLRHFRSRLARYFRAPRLCRQCRADGAVGRCQEGHHRAHRRLPGNRRWRLGRDRDSIATRRSRPLCL